MKTLFSFLILSFVVALFDGCSTDINRQLRKYGYTELQPPSRLVPPGTIVEIKQPRPLIVSRICVQTSSLGGTVANFLTPSPTAEESIKRQFTGNFDLGVDYLNQISSSTKFKNVKKLTVTLSNVSLVDLSMDTVFKLVTNRDLSCIQAITFAQNEKAKMTMISSAIVADVEYHVEWSKELSESAKATLKKQIALTLGFDISQSGDESIKGGQLIWGVRDDQRLIKISASTLIPTGNKNPMRLLPAGKNLMISE